MRTNWIAFVKPRVDLSLYLYIFHNQDKFFSDEIYLNASERKLHGILKAYLNKAEINSIVFAQDCCVPM